MGFLWLQLSMSERSDVLLGRCNPPVVCFRLYVWRLDASPSNPNLAIVSPSFQSVSCPLPHSKKIRARSISKSCSPPHPWVLSSQHLWTWSEWLGPTTNCTLDPQSTETWEPFKPLNLQMHMFSWGFCSLKLLPQPTDCHETGRHRLLVGHMARSHFAWLRNHLRRLALDIHFAKKKNPNLDPKL